MKLVVTYFVDADDEEVRLEGCSFAPTDEALFAIQQTVDRFEADGVTIDQGGDDDAYELDIADCDPTNVEERARALLVACHRILERGKP